MVQSRRSNTIKQRHDRTVDRQSRDSKIRQFPIAAPSTPLYLVPTLAKLEAATRKPVCVKPNTHLDEAIALMLLHDYSQLPVLTGEREVKGMVSWRSIGRGFAMNGTGSEVRDYLDPRPKIRDLSTPLIEAVADVIKHEVILVRDEKRRIVGLVTSTDLSVLLKDIAEVFLRLGEIEHHLRRIIAARFSVDELRSVRANEQPSRPINSPGDLTFGDYVRLLQVPEHWARLNVRVAQAPTLRRLDEVRTIRNHVMHFGDRDLTPAERQTLADTARFMAVLASSIAPTTSDRAID